MRIPVRRPRLWLGAGSLAAAAASGALYGRLPALADPLLVVAVLLVAAGTVALAGGITGGADPVDLSGDVRTPRRGTDLVPLSMESFRGREAELAELGRRHDEARAARGDTPAGAVLLLVHGRPGVGKSALARAFARRVLPEYPDGLLYANLGIGGDRRPPGEVLRAFLEALHWTEPLPAGTDDRVRIFRSLTANARLLVVLDAARDTDQVRALLPTGSGCTVIVSGRRDLSPGLTPSSPSLRVDVPNQLDAAEMLRSAARLDRFADPVCVARIVAHCGALPLALQAAGEAAADNAHVPICKMADRLDDPASRLDRLAFRNRDVRERIRAEYDRLTEAERRAFALLALVPSETFLPGVLAPLMQLSFTEAENLVASLYAAQLVDVAGADSPSGLARYRFHPLLRLYATGVLEQHVSPSERDAALARLDELYLQIIERVLRRADRGFTTRRVSAPPLPAWIEYLPEQIAAVSRQWTQAEYASLIRSIHAAAAAGEPGMCWRIAARLDDYLPHDTHVTTALAAFDVALDAADLDASPAGRIAVSVSKGALLLAAERYAEGVDLLRQVIRDPQAPAAEVLRACRALSESYLQTGAHAEARSSAARGLEVGAADGPDSADDAAMLRLVAVLAGTQPQPLREVEDRLRERESVPAGDRTQFWTELSLAEVERRQRHWSAASALLAQARAAAHGDGRRAAIASGRLTELLLAQARAGGDDPARPAREAVDRAAATIVLTDRLGNRVESVRARSVLARALIAAERPDLAEQQLAEPLLVPVGASTWTLGAAVDGLVSLTQGELRSAQGDEVAAARHFADAEARFLVAGDWSAVAEARARLGRTYDRQGHPRNAVRILAPAVEALTAAGDRDAVAALLESLSAQVRENLAAPGAARRLPDAEHAELLTLVRRAFAETGVELHRGPRPQLLVPGPVWVSMEIAPSAAEIGQLLAEVGRGRYAEEQRPVYLVHAEPLRRDAQSRLDSARLLSTPIVAVPAGALRAAFTDGNTGPYLRELERIYGGQEDLFEIRNALIAERFLFGRDRLLNRIGDRLRRQEQVMVTGLRKVGKTSVLNILRQHLTDRPVCFVDCQDLDRDSPGWPAELFGQVVDAFDRWGRANTGDWQFQPRPVRSATDLARELGRRYEAAPGAGRLVVILDELERVYPLRSRPAAARHWVQATGALRSLAQRTERLLSVVAADLRPTANRTNRLVNGETNPFFSFFTETPVPLLDAPATTDMINTLAREMGVEHVEPQFCDRLYELTGGHPLLSRLVAGAGYRNRADQLRLQAADLDSGLRETDANDSITSFLWQNFWGELSRSERAVLRRFMAGHGDNDGDGDREGRVAEAALHTHGVIEGDRIRIGLVRTFMTDGGRR